MNFKITKLKIISSLIISIIFGIVIYFTTNTCFGECPKLEFIELINRILQFFVVPFLVLFVLIYIIWSLIQKKKILESSETIRQTRK